MERKIVKIKHCKCFPVIVRQYRRAMQENTLKYVCNEGGTRSGKTFDFFLFCFWYALQNAGTEKIIRIFRQTNTTCLANTFLADFITAINIFGIADQFELRKGFARCRTTNIFFSGLSRGGQVLEATHSDVLFFNEAMECEKLNVDKWIMRCRELVVMDWNPSTTSHWVFDYEFNPDCVFTHSTYKDNPNLQKSVIQTVESYEPTPENRAKGTANDYLWNVYGLGLRTESVGMMYKEFSEYDILPITQRAVRKNYTDTADTGDNYLCSICYIETELGCYVTDVLYTKKPMEYTEVATAKMLLANRTDQALIESNNGGRGFARNVEENIRKEGNFNIVISTFHQGDNKLTRIFTNSAKAQNLIFMPVGWKTAFPEFSRDLLSYKQEGKNPYDDAPDAITGIVENYQVDRLFPENTTQYFDSTPQVPTKRMAIVVKLDNADNPIASVVYNVIDTHVYVTDVVYSYQSYDSVAAQISEQLAAFQPTEVRIYASSEWRNYVTLIRERAVGINVGRYALKYDERELSIAKSNLIQQNFLYLSVVNQSKMYADYMRDKHGYIKYTNGQKRAGVICDSLAAAIFHSQQLIK